MKIYLKKGITAGILLIIISFLLYQVGFNKIVDAFSSVNYSSLIFIFFGTLILTLVYPCTLTILHYPLKTSKMPLSTFYKLRLLTQVIATITPNKIGELYLFFLLKRKYKINAVPTFYIFILDKLASFIHVLLFSSIGFFMILKDISASTVSLFIFSLIILGIFLGNYLLGKLKRLSKLFFMENNLKNIFTKTVDFYRHFTKKNFHIITYNIIATFLVFGLTALVMKLIFLSLNVDVAFAKIYLIINMISLASFIPLNILGIGIKEISSVYFYSLIGVDMNITILTVLLLTVAKYITCLIFYLGLRT